MRKYLRAIARENMKKAGMERINKPDAEGRSPFSRHWREALHWSETTGAKRAK